MVSDHNMKIGTLASYVAVNSTTMISRAISDEQRGDGEDHEGQPADGVVPQPKRIR